MAEVPCTRERGFQASRPGSAFTHDQGRDKHKCRSGQRAGHYASGPSTPPGREAQEKGHCKGRRHNVDLSYADESRIAPGSSLSAEDSNTHDDQDENMRHRSQRRTNPRRPIARSARPRRLSVPVIQIRLLGQGRRQSVRYCSASVEDDGRIRICRG